MERQRAEDPLPHLRLATFARLVTAAGVLLGGWLTIWYVRSVPTRTQVATLSLVSIVAMLTAAGLTLPGRLAVGLLSAAATFAFFFGSGSITGFGILLVTTSGLAVSALGLTLVALPREPCLVDFVSAIAGGVLGLAAFLLFFLIAA